VTAGTLRIGVTGHRTFDDPDGVAAQVDAAIGAIVERSGDVGLEVWSSLAEGADRLVARLLIDRGAEIVAVLPLEPDDYRADFATPESQAEFDRLLARAREVRLAGVGAASREAAYEAAGLAVVGAVDVLLALWDGAESRGRGGTAEIVAAARRRGREVVVVPVTRPGDEPTPPG